jgi:hypothetical protein
MFPTTATPPRFGKTAKAAALILGIVVFAPRFGYERLILAGGERPDRIPRQAERPESRRPGCDQP